MQIEDQFASQQLLKSPEQLHSVTARCMAVFRESSTFLLFDDIVQVAAAHDIEFPRRVHPVNQLAVERFNDPV